MNPNYVQGINLPKLTCWLTINRACNMRCDWCYAKMTGFNASQNMTPETVDRSIALASDLGLDAIILIGGEPTIHPDFLEIVKKITAAGMKAYVVTNAIRFSNQKFLDKALEAGIKSITISFKASNREDYLRFTHRDVFGKAVKATQNIAASGVEHAVNITACEELMGNLDQMIDVIKKTGAKSFSIDSGKPVILNSRPESEGIGSPKRMAEFFMEAYPKLKQSGMMFAVKIAVPFCLFPKSFIDMVIEEGNILTGCQMVSGRGIIIDPAGKLIPCNHLCDQSMADVKDLQSADGYVSYRKNPSVIRFYKLVASSPHENCLECEYWQKCGAGCKLYWLQNAPESMVGNFEEKGG